jgi:hypothetical protein
MDRRRCCKSSDSESGSLGTVGLRQPAGLRHSPAPTGVGRGTSDGHGSGGGDNGKPGRTGPPSKISRYGIFKMCRWVQALTPRDLISHRFTLSLYKGLSRYQRNNLRSSYKLTMDNRMINTSDTPNASLWQAMCGFNHRGSDTLCNAAAQLRTARLRQQWAPIGDCGGPEVLWTMSKSPGRRCASGVRFPSSIRQQRSRQ